MNFQDRVSIDLADNGVAQVRFTRGDKMNALDGAQFEAVLEAGQALREMKGLRVAVLSGEGRAFCAGLDLSSMAAGGSNPQARLVDRTHGNANRAQEAAMTWRKCPVPVIAAVHGVCFGGGLQIASGADIRVVHPATRMAVMEMKWGLVPDMSGCATVRRLVRDDVLRLLTYTAQRLDGTQAQAHGLVTEVSADPLARAQAIADAIAGRSPSAIRACKTLLNTLDDGDAAEILQAESDLQQSVMGGPNQVEAVMANLEKRAPVFAD